MSNFEMIRNIAYLEPQTSFSEMAKDEFCHMLKLEGRFSTPLTTIKQIVDYVAKNPDTVGVLPVENTLQKSKYKNNLWTHYANWILSIIQNNGIL